jgi:hypothetical protein
MGSLPQTVRFKKMLAASILRRNVLPLVLAVGIVASLYASTLAQTDPLPSWNDGTVKKSIFDFVVRATQGGPDFVPAPERISTFDNDGTLWTEQTPANRSASIASSAGGRSSRSEIRTAICRCCDGPWRGRGRASPDIADDCDGESRGAPRRA